MEERRHTMKNPLTTSEDCVVGVLLGRTVEPGVWACTAHRKVQGKLGLYHSYVRLTPEEAQSYPVINDTRIEEEDDDEERDEGARGREEAKQRRHRTSRTTGKRTPRAEKETAKKNAAGVRFKRTPEETTRLTRIMQKLQGRVTAARVTLEMNVTFGASYKYQDVRRWALQLFPDRICRRSEPETARNHTVVGFPVNHLQEPARCIEQNAAPARHRHAGWTQYFAESFSRRRAVEEEAREAPAVSPPPRVFNP